MIFIAGITPKIKRLDENPRKCPGCGQQQASLKRVDHYLNLFFIPVLRVKKGDPFVLCDACCKGSPQHGDKFPSGSSHAQQQYPICGRELAPDCQYCPFCGKRM